MYIHVFVSLCLFIGILNYICVILSLIFSVKNITNISYDFRVFFFLHFDEISGMYVH